MRDRIRARLDRLTPEATAVAGAVAVLGAPSAPTVIEDVAEVSADAVEVALDELVENHLLAETTDQPGHYELASPLIARAITALLPPTKRRALHARAAEVLVKRDLAATAERSLLPYHLARAESQSVESPVVTRKPAWAKRSVVAGVAGIAVVTLAAVAITQRDQFRSPFR